MNAGAPRALVFALMLAACGASQRAAPAARTAAPVADAAVTAAPSADDPEEARAGCLVLRRSAVDLRLALVQPAQPAQPAQPGATPPTREFVRDLMLREAPLARLCSDYSYVVDEPTLDRTVQELRESNQLGVAQFEQRLRERGLSLAQYRALLAGELCRAQLFARWARRDAEVESARSREAFERNLEVTRATGEVRFEALFVGPAVHARTAPAPLVARARALARRAQEDSSLEALAREPGAAALRFEPAPSGFMALSSLTGPEGDALADAPEDALLGPLLYQGRLALLHLVARRGEPPPSLTALRVALNRERFGLRRATEERRFDDELLRQARATTAATTQGRCVETPPARNVLRLEGLVLRGNTSVPTPSVLAALREGGPDALRFGPLGELPLALTNALSMLYADLGYLLPTLDYTLPEPGAEPAALVLTVDEGPRYRVGRLRVLEVDREGHERHAPPERVRTFTTHSGDWFSRARLGADLAVLRESYRAQGYTSSAPEVDALSHGELTAPAVELTVRLRFETAPTH